MPTINLKPIKEKTIEYKHTDNSAEFYNSLAWHRLRKYYYNLHPICEECIKRGRVVPATDVHHKLFWDSQKTVEEKWNKFLDEHNLMSLCEACHYGIHNKARHYKLNYCCDLTDKEYIEAHKEIHV